MVKLAKHKVDCNGLKSCIRANWFCFKYVFLCKETSRVLKKLLRYLWCQALHKKTLPIATILEKKYYNIGVAPNLHFPHLHQTQIYKTHIYTKPRFTQTQIYTAQIYTHPNLHSPILAYPNLHNSNLHQTEPKFTQPKFTQNPNL